MKHGGIIYSLHHRNHTYIDSGNGKIGNEKSDGQ